MSVYRILNELYCAPYRTVTDIDISGSAAQGINISFKYKGEQNKINVYGTVDPFTVLPAELF